MKFLSIFKIYNNKGPTWIWQAEVVLWNDAGRVRLEILNHLSNNKRKRLQFRGYDEYPNFNYSLSGSWRGRVANSSLTGGPHRPRNRKVMVESGLTLKTETEIWLIPESTLTERFKSVIKETHQSLSVSNNGISLWMSFLSIRSGPGFETRRVHYLPFRNVTWMYNLSNFRYGQRLLRMKINVILW